MESMKILSSGKRLGQEKKWKETRCIPRKSEMIYKIKQVQDGKPMTKIVDEILRPVVQNEKLVKYNSTKKGGNKDVL
jgi:hypothetical protein